jgi:hypothetical protein
LTSLKHPLNNHSFTLFDPFNCKCDIDEGVEEVELEEVVAMALGVLVAIAIYRGSGVLDIYKRCIEK